MSKRISNLVAVGLFLISPVLAFSKQGGVKPDDYKIRYIGIEKGLSNNSVTTLYQDQKGFMWIGWRRSAGEKAECTFYSGE